MAANWFYLVLIYIVTNSSSKLIQKHALKDNEINPTAFSAYFLFTVGLLSTPFLLFEKVTYPTEPKVWMAVLLSGVLYTLCMALFFHAMQGTEVSQVETISTTRSIWFMLLGIIFFQETLTLSKFLGVIFIFLGLVVVYRDKGQFTGIKKPHIYTFIYAILISSSYALDKYALDYFSVALYQIVIYIIPSLLTVLFIPKSISDIKYLIKPRKNNYIIILSFFFQTISTLALYRAYQTGGELSVVGPLAQTTTIVIIVFGMLVLKERWNMKKKVAGIALTVLGVMFIRLT